ncbi:sulfurtransferase [Prauserella cavernicola]|uniref:Sulfurtransferase n=1 Tax=Prauserella cavernicola TaxID=2800127 RepID=A0A934QUN0_9PSEU|nr:sulfurtransferase [Prauserella cavernicola]MBK1786631.1 sulfurtransferase [Prauserella cavernicola]
MSTPLTDVATLRAELAGTAPPVLLDVRWALATHADRDGYRAGHLPSAGFVDLDRDLADPPGPEGRHPLPDPERFAGVLRRLGVGSRTPVVCYDAGPGTAAARAWWLLRFHGHPDVRVLDGGLAAWQAAGGPVESGDGGSGEPGDFTPVPGRALVLTADEVPEFVAGGGLLLDARDTDRFLGRTEPVDPVAGHIPGAVSAPTLNNVDERGRFLVESALRSRFEDLGAREGRQVAVYCGSGVTAAHQVLALEAAGVAAALYPGSWSHWITDSAREVATGP